MLLTSSDILRPIAGMSFLIVQKTSNAELFSGSSIPAGPVSGARRLVAEDAVEPVAVVGA